MLRNIVEAGLFPFVLCLLSALTTTGFVHDVSVRHVPKGGSSPLLTAATRWRGSQQDGERRRRVLPATPTISILAAAPVGSSYPASSSNPRSSPPSIEDVDVLVVGGGLTGCTAAFYLHRAGGVKVALCEAEGEWGGAIRSRVRNGVGRRGDERYMWEEGPNSFQPSPHLMQLIADLGLNDRLVVADGNLPRFVYDRRRKRLHALPMSLSSFVRSRFLSTWGKLRLLAGLVGLPGVVRPRPPEEESVAHFMSRHLGDEALDRLADPFISGVYAGDPRRLSISAALPKLAALDSDDGGGSSGGRRGRRSTFWGGLVGGALRQSRRASGVVAASRRVLPPIVTKGRRRRRNGAAPRNMPRSALGSFEDGLQSIPKAVVGKLGPGVARANWRLIGVSKIAAAAGSPRYLARFRTTDGVERLIRARTVLITSPAHTTATLVEAAAPEAARHLRKIDYPPIASVVLACNASAVQPHGPRTRPESPLRGFGHLIPRSSNIRTLGTIWSSALFQEDGGRAPKGRVVLTSFIGGAQDRGVAKLSTTELVAQVRRDLERVLFRKDKRRRGDDCCSVLGVRRWAKAIPQYNIGHGGIIKDVDAALASRGLSGMLLRGNWRTGVALKDCVCSGMETADEIKRELGGRL